MQDDWKRDCTIVSGLLSIFFPFACYLSLKQYRLEAAARTTSRMGCCSIVPWKDVCDRLGVCSQLLTALFEDISDRVGLNFWFPADLLHETEPR